jgi:hypothetical protein
MAFRTNAGDAFNDFELNFQRLRWQRRTDFLHSTVDLQQIINVEVRTTGKTSCDIVMSTGQQGVPPHTPIGNW